MHSALLIDEILRLIFESALDDGKLSLCIAARCCQAWKDPALDQIWRRLPSAVPLLSFLPGFSLEKGCIRLGPITQGASLATFHSYSIRVKHIVHCHHVLADLTSIPVDLLYPLSNLESAHIGSRAMGRVPLHMSMGPQLRALALRVGYTEFNSASTTVHSMASLFQGCPLLERLSVRGCSWERLHIFLSSITTLRSLSLHLSSLTEQCFVTVSTLPLLVDLDVHANCLSNDCLSVAIGRTCDASFFPALEKLKIRAQPALVALIIEQLPRNKLRSLHVEATGSAPSAFRALFESMATLLLHEFTLEYALSIDEFEGLSRTSGKVFTIDQLRPLAKLPLRRFILDSIFPPDLSDADIEEMTTWWPLLHRLELGARTALEDAETTWVPRNSLASLSTLAKGCAHLKHLVITLDVNPARSVPDLGSVPIVPHPLTSLSISSRSRPNVTSLSTMLSRLFPSLVGPVSGFVDGHVDAWADVQAALFMDRNLQTRD